MSRQTLIDSRFSSLACATVFGSGEGLSTQVAVGPSEGLKHPSWIMCDNLASIRKADLTDYVGSLSAGKLAELHTALNIALDLTWIAVVAAVSCHSLSLSHNPANSLSKCARNRVPFTRNMSAKATLVVPF